MAYQGNHHGYALPRPGAAVASLRKNLQHLFLTLRNVGSKRDKVGSLGAVLSIKLAQNALHMLLHGLLRDVQFIRNIAITNSLAD